MPWSHCGADDVPDTDPCPACGLSKSEWTVQLDRTRTLRLGSSSGRVARRDAWLELALKDGAGRPVGGAAYRVALQSGRVLEGALGEDGAARLEKLPPGVCEVSFPEHGVEGLERETNARHEVRLGGGVRLEAVLRTSRGEPLEHTAFVVKDATGAEVARGETDARGVARADVPAAGEYRIEVAAPAPPADDAPDHVDEEDWEGAWAAAGGGG